MKQILFATSNERKIGEARLGCQDFDIEVVPIKLDIDEIQHHDPIAISTHKAAEAFRLAGKPVVVTDTSWSIPALGGFPGGYMKDVAIWFQPEDFIHLMNSKQDRRISFTETITYIDARTTRTFSQQYWGEIVEAPRGAKGNSIELVAAFDGFTLAERHDQGRFSHDPKEYIWYQFAQWYAGQDAAKAA